MDQTIELVGLLDALIFNFLLLLGGKLGFESLILSLLLLDLATSFLIVRFLNKALLVVTGEVVHAADDGTVIDEDLLATLVDEAIVLAGGSFALLVLLLEHSLLDLKILDLLLGSTLGILLLEFLLGGSLLLLLGWLLVCQSLMFLVFLMGFVLSKRLG